MPWPFDRHLWGEGSWCEGATCECLLRNNLQTFARTSKFLNDDGGDKATNDDLDACNLEGDWEELQQPGEQGYSQIPCDADATLVGLDNRAKAFDDEDEVLTSLKDDAAFSKLR